MTVAVVPQVDDDESSLSDVDERFIAIKDPLISNALKMSAGRQKMPKSRGVNARDKNHGRTALHKASARGNIEKIQELVEVKGAMIDITDNAGATPLHDACSRGHANVVRYLLTKGASLGARDSQGDYPLLDAAQNDHLDICRILLEAGANPTTQNSEGMSALSEAEEGPVKELLREYSSRFDSPGQNRMRITDVLSIEDDNIATATTAPPQRGRERPRPRSSQLHIDSRGARKVDINGRDQLHQYVIEEDDDLVEQFLEIQDCDHQDNYGDTPLHTAARLKNAHICGLLLQHGAKASLRNKQGNTALHEACYVSDNREVISALLDAGASSLSTNLENMVPSQIAETQLGKEAFETRLLRRTAEKEQAKREAKRRKRGMTRDRTDSLCGSAKTSPMHSPVVSRFVDDVKSPETKALKPHQEALAAKPVRRKPPCILDDTAQEIAVTVATSAPPEIVSSTKQIVKSGVPTTQFLTQFKANTNLSHVDSSVRGSPLPSLPPPVKQHSPDERGRTTSPSKPESPLQVAVNEANPIRSPGPIKRKPTIQIEPHAEGSRLPKRHKTSERSSSPTSRPRSPHLASVLPLPLQTNDIHRDHDQQQRLPTPTTTTAAMPPDGEKQIHDGVTNSILQLGRDLVTAIEKQNEIMQMMARTLDTLAHAQKDRS